MSEASITLTGVFKRYENSGVESDAEGWAVCGVSLSVFPGELTVLMGPSGSGKTTVLSMIGGLLDVTHGRLSVLGTDLEHRDEAEVQQFRRENIGFIFQNFNLLSALTARENVEIALALRERSHTDAGTLLEIVGLSEKADAFPSELSGGQRQRIGIARALAGNPPILLADEPTAALDTEHGRRVMELLRKRAHEFGTTVLVVTHDPRVRELSDRVIEMEDGRLKQIVRLVRGQGLSRPSVRDLGAGSLLTRTPTGALRGAKHGTN